MHTHQTYPLYTPHITYTPHTHHSHTPCAHRLSLKGSLFTKHALPEEASLLLSTQPGILFPAFSEIKFSQCCMTQLTCPPFPDASGGPCPVRGSSPLPLCWILFSAHLRQCSRACLPATGAGPWEDRAIAGIPAPQPPRPREPGD